MSTRVDPEFASAKWLGNQFDIEPRTVRDLSRRGLFPAYRLSHKVIRYRVSEVRAALEAGAR
ncbi:hypothetical protein MYCOZU2_03909 [Mycobacterium intracellulare subsp. chimaera]|uniref:Helix-turn-helix domain-containing protein n=1 Tax=Mycobacterium intracellulare subsp. chimaera TaxID=222805 RepID=A0A7U5MML9_MYCIT|nr:hypothetical protein MYCOZU2_03909 [Mycobacterium intracellulare subsp. chimaera]